MSPTGVVSAYNIDTRHGYAYIAIVVMEDASFAVTGEAAAMFIDHLFERLAIEVVLWESAVEAVQKFTSLSRLAVERVRLRRGSGLSDVTITSLSRETWMTSTAIAHMRANWREIRANAPRTIGQSIHDSTSFSAAGDVRHSA
jgi:hypothetical protein